MDLTFQVPMQYRSLHHQTLLPSPVISTAECCFSFGSVSSFFLELFLHSSPEAYWAPTNLEVHLSVSYLFAFSYSSWGFQGKNTEVVCHSLLELSQGVRKRKQNSRWMKTANTTNSQTNSLLVNVVDRRRCV